MPTSLIFFLAAEHCIRTVSLVVIDLVHLAVLAAYCRRSLAAENLFLRKQLALFQERKVKPRRADDSTRWLMATLSQMFPWRGALVNVKPDTLNGLAPQGISAVLAMEVETEWASTSAQEPSTVNSTDGPPRIGFGARSALPMN